MRSFVMLFGMTAGACTCVGQIVTSTVASPPLAGQALFAKQPLVSGLTPKPDDLLSSTNSIGQTTSQNASSKQASVPNRDYEGSPDIPLDSWIYPVFDRLAALGYLPDATAMIRPWSRLEAARLITEAHTQYFEMDETGEALLASLDEEFASDTRSPGGMKNSAAEIESVYARFTGIGGTPLRDGYHFSQTLVDDFGRPYGQGANQISGFSARGHSGPFAFNFRGEYQYASPIPLGIYGPGAQQALVSDDTMPFGWNLRFGNTNHLRPIEAYVSFNLHNWQLSFGQQSLWWGPDRTNSLILSNNAAPMPMLRIGRTKPAYLPGPFRIFGPLHLELFMARQGGIHYVRLGPNFTPYGTPDKALTPPPYLWGVHLTLKPTQFLELGIAHTVIFAGYGRPLTFGTFFHSFSVLGNGQDVDPGKRVTEINMNYHIPGYRRAIEVYSEGMAWDDPIQGKFVARFAWNPGVYVTELPKLHSFDARFEGVYTNLPKDYYVGYFYANPHYAQGYTNYGQILGSWVGRQGVGGQATTTHWFSPKTKASLFFRKMVSSSALLGGGSNSDIGMNGTWRIKPDIELTGLAQYERWNFPLLQQTSRSNFTGSIEVRFYPKFGIQSHESK